MWYVVSAIETILVELRDVEGWLVFGVEAKPVVWRISAIASKAEKNDEEGHTCTSIGDPE